MAVQQARQTDDSAIVAEMNFCIPGEKVIFYPTDREKSQWPYRPHEVTIRDARAVAGELELEKNGFVLVERASVRGQGRAAIGQRCRIWVVDREPRLECGVPADLPIADDKVKNTRQ